MIRARARGPHLQRRLPRTSGDDPITDGIVEVLSWFAPHKRG